MDKRLKINVNSEIGELEGVILHRPGQEIENMTPNNAERALYSDILNLAVASKEYSQFEEVLRKVTKVFEVNELLEQILLNEKVKEELTTKILSNENVCVLFDTLMSLNNKELAQLLLEGVEMRKDNLTKYLSDERYILQPLHNFFFTRDASVSIGNEVLISRMASKVRKRESIIMEAIFDYSPNFNTKTINFQNIKNIESLASYEGGDILVPREDILLIGLSSRTTSQGIDFIIERMKEKKVTKHIVVQELPKSPESFIHLDMVFTFLDVDKCMIYEPVIMMPNRYQTVHIQINNGKVTSISNDKNILSALSELGINLKPISCGGASKDVWAQEREQWHSGANFFAMAPGKVIGYGRNVYTIEEMNKNGFEVIRAKDVINGTVDLSQYSKYVVTIEGSELSRGGGGARCMTMPISRKTVDI